METQHLLWFSQDFSPNSFLLIELEESFVQLIENSDSNVYFVGCSKAKEEESPCFRADEAYLCTDRKTFKVLFRESSNCILPIEASQNNCANSRVSVVLQSDIVPVNTLVHGNLELSPTNPRIDVLRRLISQYQSKNNLVNLGIQQILDRVQISELQLKDQLKRMHVVPFEGGLKILTCTEMERVLDDIISTGVLQNWEIPLRLPPANEILKYCDDHPPIMIQHCLDYFCIPRVDNCLRLDEYSVCRFKAMRF